MVRSGANRRRRFADEVGIVESLKVSKASFKVEVLIRLKQT